MPSDSHIIIPDSQVPVLIAFYEAEVARLALEVEEGESKLRALQQRHIDAKETLAILKGEKAQQNHKFLAKENVETSRITPYPMKGSFWDKIKWSLVDKQMVLSAREIMNCIYKQEPLLRIGGKDADKKISINIFSTLTNKWKDEELYRSKVGQDYKYGFRNWFTDDGERVLQKFDNDEIDVMNEEAIKDFVIDD